MMPAWSHHHLRLAGLLALLCVLAVALAGFGGSAQSSSPPAEPLTVGPVTDFSASIDGAAPGSVCLTWSAAENAQVHFIYYIEKKELDARNWAAGRMRAFNGTEATVDGLTADRTYYFAARGMLWDFGKFEAVWGDWVYWETATPATRPTGKFNSCQLGVLFDDIINKTERREAFSEVKESNIGFSALDDMKGLRSEFVASETETELWYALVKLSNARRDRHLRVRSVYGGLEEPEHKAHVFPRRFTCCPITRTSKIRHFLSRR